MALWTNQIILEWLLFRSGRSAWYSILTVYILEIDEIIIMSWEVGGVAFLSSGLARQLVRQDHCEFLLPCLLTRCESHNMKQSRDSPGSGQAREQVSISRADRLGW